MDQGAAFTGYAALCRSEALTAPRRLQDLLSRATPSVQLGAADAGPNAPASAHPACSLRIVTTVRRGEDSAHDRDGA